MSAAKHTPGDWVIVEQFPYGAYDTPEVAANARLICAAPDLLNLARRVAEHFADTDAPLGSAARDALAKATGEGA